MPIFGAPIDVKKWIIWHGEWRIGNSVITSASLGIRIIPLCLFLDIVAPTKVNLSFCDM